MKTFITALFIISAQNAAADTVVIDFELLAHTDHVSFNYGHVEESYSNTGYSTA